MVASIIIYSLSRSLASSLKIRSKTPLFAAPIGRCVIQSGSGHAAGFPSPAMNSSRRMGHLYRVGLSWAWPQENWGAPDLAGKIVDLSVSVRPGGLDQDV